MHELEFEHFHAGPEERQQLAGAIWSADNVELTTVGIDIGSSTSHLMFARLHMQRLATALSSRFVTVGRELLWQSPILLTPYRADYTIDASALAAFIDDCYARSGLARADIDSGAVILTGEALKRHNARAIAELFSAEAGRFVCASAGHHLESQLAAHGSGAVKLSSEKRNTVLNVDIGGGTTKFALVRDGEFVATAAIAVGGRLLVENARGLARIEEPTRAVARELGIKLRIGGKLAPKERHRLAERMAGCILAMIGSNTPDALARSLLVTDAWPAGVASAKIDAITFSGGVAEYLYGRERGRYGDLGADLAHSMEHAIADERLPAPVWDPGQGIRATVTGAAQFSVQVSGNTILVTDPGQLPLRNLPVLCCSFDLSENIAAAAVSACVRAVLAKTDFIDGSGPVALAFPWEGDPSHARLLALAAGLCAAVPKTVAARAPLVLLVDGDVAKNLGRIVHLEVAPGANVVAIDNVQLKQLEYVDVGAIVPVTGVVPVIIKSLLF